jgi:hypothetical protein
MPTALVKWDHKNDKGETWIIGPSEENLATHSGVVGDGFQIVAFPVANAMARFQPYTVDEQGSRGNFVVDRNGMSPAMYARRQRPDSFVSADNVGRVEESTDHSRGS